MLSDCSRRRMQLGNRERTSTVTVTIGSMDMYGFLSNNFSLGIIIFYIFLAALPFIVLLNLLHLVRRFVEVVEKAVEKYVCA